MYKLFISTKKSIDYSEYLRNDIPFMCYSIVAAAAIPLNDILIYPIFCQCSGLKSHFKILIGAITLLGGYTVTTVLFTYSRKVFTGKSISHNDTSVQCLFHETTNSLKDTIDFKLFSIPEVLFSISNIWFMMGTLSEYYCAQVPYSMKGLLIGCCYAFFGLFVSLHYGSSFLFTTKLLNWPTGTIYSCGFWYLLSKIILMVITVFLCFLIFKCCKMRIREDVLPSEHIFAERYYSRGY